MDAVAMTTCQLHSKLEPSVSVQTGPVVVHHALFSLLKNNHVSLPREGVFDVCTATHTDLPGGHRN